MSVDTEIQISVDDDWVPDEGVVQHDDRGHDDKDTSKADVSDADFGQIEMMQDAVAGFISQLKLTSSDMLRTTAAHRALWRFGRPLRDGR